MITKNVKKSKGGWHVTIWGKQMMPENNAAGLDEIIEKLAEKELTLREEEAEGEIVSFVE